MAVQTRGLIAFPAAFSALTSLRHIPCYRVIIYFHGQFSFFVLKNDSKIIRTDEFLAGVKGAARWKNFIPGPGIMKQYILRSVFITDSRVIPWPVPLEITSSLPTLAGGAGNPATVTTPSCEKDG
jgi:hypothetical protein